MGVIQVLVQVSVVFLILDVTIMAPTSASKDELMVDISHFTSVLVQLTIISLYAFLDNPPTWKENVRPQQCWDSHLLMSACYNSGSKRMKPLSDYFLLLMAAV